MKAISLISAGIDSPVSSYLMMKKCELMFLHFDGGRVKDVLEILEVLRAYSSQKRLVLIVVDHDCFMKELRKLDFPESQTCVYCKTSMLLFAERMCKEFECEAIVTGDSLGQVASQTLLNMKAEESLLEFPVIRPLIGLDKVEIVEVARRIGTYEISTRSKESCPYAPRHPVTRGCEVLGEVKNIVDSVEYEVLELPEPETLRI